MRSFFNKPTWASTEEEERSSEFYRRSLQTYQEIVQANQRKSDRVTCSTPKGTFFTDQRQSKRRRLSKSNSPTVTEETPSQLFQSKEDTEQESPHATSVSSNDGADVGHHADHAISPAAATVNNAVDSELKKLPYPDDSKRSISELNSSTPPSSGQSAGAIIRASASSTVTLGRTTTANEDDPIVQIFISSAIKNTNPLIVQRHVSQRLRDVRLAWCERQGFDRKFTSTVILTWRGKRVFDVTTCKSLFIGPAIDDDRISWSSQSHDQETSHLQRHEIHLVATTTELLAAAQKESRKASEPPSRSSSDPDISSDEKLIQVVLKSLGQDEMKIKVRPGTRISAIIKVFREKRIVSDLMAVDLSFDGEILGTDTCIEDHDIADLDLLDVFIKPR